MAVLQRRQRDVVLIGVSNRIEVWAKELWTQFYETSKDLYEAAAEKLMDEGKSA